MMRFESVAVLLALATGSGCSPTFDWREFVPEGSGIGVAFPCRPDRHARPVSIGGHPVTMNMLVCSAADTTFALSYADLADPAVIGPALGELRALAQENVEGVASAAAPLELRGMTPNARSVRLVLDGHLPGGAAVREHAAFFSRGLRVYQATVIGSSPPTAAADTFFAGLRFPG